MVSAVEWPRQLVRFSGVARGQRKPGMCFEKSLYCGSKLPWPVQCLGMKKANFIFIEKCSKTT